MSDFALTASVDFRDADKQVDAFVQKTKKKLSDILAAARASGGSMSARAGTASSALGSIGGIDANSTKAMLDRISRLEKAFVEGNIKMRRAAEADYTRFWKQELAERDRAEQAALKKSQERLRGSRAVSFGSTGTKSAIDALFPTDAEIAQRSAKMRAQFEKAAATGSATRRSQGTQSFIDSLFPSDAEIAQRSAKLRAQFERGAATGSVTRRSQGTQSFIDSLFPSDADIAQRTAKLRTAFERGMATGRVYNQTGGYQSLIDRLVGGGTGSSASIAEFYRKQAEAAENAAKRISAANEKASTNSSLSLVRATGAAENSALGVSNRIGRQLGEDPALQAQLVTRLDRALADYNNTLRTYGTRSSEAAKASVTWNRELQSIRGVIAEKGGLLRTLNSNTQTLRGSIESLGTGFGSLSRLMLNTQVVLSSLMAVFGLREIIQTIQDLERFTATLKTVSGGAAEFQTNLRYLYSEADRIGFSVSDVGNSFARLSIAMKNAGFNGDETRQIFTGLTEASRNFGLSSADTMGVIRALEQSMSKGVFQAEEVRLQLGDRLPVAMAALKAAMEQVDGKAVDVSKRFEQGSVDVQRYASAFVQQINIMSGGAQTLATTSNGVSAAFGRLGTEFTRTAEAMDKGGFGQAVVSVTDQIRDMMREARDSGALDAIGNVALAVANNFTTLAGALTAAVAAFAAIRVAMGLFALATATLNPAALAISAITGAAALMGAAWANSATRADQAARTIGQTVSSAAKIAEQSTASVADAAQVLSSGLGTAATNAESEFARMVRSFQNAGNSLKDAMRMALETTRDSVQAQVEVLQNLSNEAKQSLENYVNATTGISRAQRALTSLRGEATGSGAYAAPDAFAEYTKQYESLMAKIQRGEEPVAALARQLGDLRTSIEGTLDKAVENQDPFKELYAGLATQIGTLLDALRGLDEVKLNGLRGQIEQIAQRLQTAQGNVGSLDARLRSAGGEQFGPPVPVPVTYQDVDFGSARNRREQLAERYLRDALRQAGAVGARDSNGRNTVLGISPELGAVGGNASTMLGYLSQQAKVNPEAAKILDEYTKKLRGARTEADKLGDAVKELMQDLTRQAESAGQDAGAAQAYAAALNRVKDAAENGRGSINALAAAKKAEELVTIRLNNELSKSVREMGRQSAANDNIAKGYMASESAGRAAEVRAKAYSEALKYAKEDLDENGEATGAYREAVEKLILAIERADRSERNLAAARQIAQNNDDLEYLEAEKNLLTANAGLRERELAALRARQQNRGASPDVVAAAEASARKVVDARQENEQLKNSWAELANVGEQAFERIGSAITEAFAQGKMNAISFKDIAKAVFSEVIQAGLKLAVINPILNSLFGGTRGTLGGIMDTIGNSSGGSGGAGGFDISKFFQGSGGLNGGLDAWAGRNLSFLGFSDTTARTTQVSTAAGGVGADPNAVSGVGEATTATATLTPAGLMNGGSALGGFSSFSNVLGIAGAAMPGLMSGNYLQAGLGVGGAAIGTMILPGIGTMIGGMAGNLLGSMFGGKTANPASSVQIGIDDNGQLAVLGSKSKHMSAAEGLAETQKVLDDLNAGISSRGLSLRSSNGEMVAQTHQGKDSHLSGQDQVDLTLSTLNSLTGGSESVMKVIANEAAKGAAASLETAFESIDWVKSVYEPLLDGSGAFTNQMKELKKQYEDTTSKARSLGLAEDGLNAARDKAINLLQSQRDQQVSALVGGVTSRILRGTGENQAADLLDFDIQAAGERMSFRQSMLDLSMTAEEIAAQMVRLEEAQGAERLAIIKKYADEAAAIEKAKQDTAVSAALDAISNIRDYVSGLRVSDMSPLSAEAKYKLALEDFNSASTKAAGGDATAIANMTKYVDTLLAASRDYNGSGVTFVADFERAISMLEAVADQGPEALTASFLASTTQEQTVTLVQSLTAVKEEITALRREVRQGSNAPARVAA